MNKRLHHLFPLLLCLLYLGSCQDDEEMGLSPSETLIQMEGEGGESVIQITIDDWEIARVVNKDGDQRVFGDIYAPDGKVVRKNELLALEGLGKLEALWQTKGFVISRDGPNAITITVGENSSGEPFSFGIVLQNARETKEIVVVQNVSQGYRFKEIAYFLSEGDGDSLFVRRGTTHRFNLSSPNVGFSIAPFSGIGIASTSRFESSERDAFVWLENPRVEVDVPASIDAETVYLSGQKRVYGEVTILPFDPEGSILQTISVPAGASSYHTELEWRIRKVSYSITLTNNRTSEEKTVSGKWFEETPTGNYKIIEELE